MSNNSLLARSGQLIVFWIGFALVVVGALVMPVAPRIHPMVPIYVTAPFGVASFIGGFELLCTRLRCPHCGTRIIWDAVSRRPASEGLAGALASESCFNCGYRP